MALDPRDVPVSCNDPTTLELYEEALRQYHSYVGDPVQTIDRALERTPDFVLGHLFKAVVLMMFSEQRFVPEARAAVSAAQALAAHANPREKAITAAARRLVDGDWHGASAAFDRVLVEQPRDAFAVQSAHLLDFYRGDALNLRNRVSRVLPHWSPRVPGYSYVLGMHAFGLEECNQYAEAEATARRALEIERRDGWAVHAVAHVMEMQGRTDEGIAWLETREADWAPDNGFAYHNWWHLALYYLDRQRHGEALRVFDRQVYPGPSEIALQLVDATAMLWRLYLVGLDLGARARQLAADWERKLDVERGFYAFNDFHAMLSFVMAERGQSAARLLRDMEATAASGGGANVAMTREVGLPLVRAALAFGQGRYEEAVAEIEPVRDVANRFGGSHAQRDLLSLTLIEAAIRSGQRRLARHYIAERTVHRPGAGTGWRLLARVSEPLTVAAGPLRAVA
jgi:tetratricopeptide (TPR) repeat protein